MDKLRLAPGAIFRPGSQAYLFALCGKKFAQAEEKIGPVGSGNRRKISKADYEAEGVIFLRPEARFSYLQNLPEGENLGEKLNEAMQAIEDENQNLRGTRFRFLPGLVIRGKAWF